MSDEKNVTINLHEAMPLVQSSNNLNSNNGSSNSNNLSISSGTNGGSNATTPTATSSTITIQQTLPGSNSFVVGTKANPAIVSDGPITDPGGSLTKQVNQIK